MTRPRNAVPDRVTATESLSHLDVAYSVHEHPGLLRRHVLAEPFEPNPEDNKISCAHFVISFY